MIFILNTRPTTRFLRQPEPVLSEPGLKNPQASKIKKRILLPLKVNRFQNKPQASKIRPLQKVGFLGNNGKIFVLDLFFDLLEIMWNIQSLRTSAESVRDVSWGCLSKQSISNGLLG